MAGTNGCLFVVGAGFSYSAQAPLLKETRFLACHVPTKLGEPNPHEIYDADERQAWQRIASEGWEEFQDLTAGLLVTKEPSDQHRILARLFKENLVRHIVSFNWDDLIEKAHREEYGEDIEVISRTGASSDHALWKMHGDVNAPGERWVFPHEDGRIFDGLLPQMSKEVLLAVVVGYREQEPLVRKQLIAPLEARGSIVRIGPSLPDDPPKTFGDDATTALKKLAEGFKRAVEK